MHATMDLRGDKTMTVKTAKNRRQPRRKVKTSSEKPTKLPKRGAKQMEGDASKSPSQVKPKKAPIATRQKTMGDCNQKDDQPKPPMRRNLVSATGRQKTKQMVCPRYEPYDTYRPRTHALIEQLNGQNPTNSDKEFTAKALRAPKKRQRRPAANPKAVATVTKKTVRRARQTVPKRAAATRKKTAGGRHACGG